MRILLTPSFSMRSYKTGEWLLTRDGHYTKLKAWAYYIKRLIPSAQFDMMIPPNCDLLLTGNDLPLWFTPIVYHGYRKNVAEQRHDRGWIHEFKRPHRSELTYDLIICGNIEYTVWLKERFWDARMITTHSHGPLLNPEYLNPHWNALEVTDAFLYNGDRDTIGETILAKYGHKMHPMYNFVDALTTTVPRTVGTKKILFMSRMSDKTRFNVPKMQAILSHLSKSHDVFYTDPSELGEKIEGAKYLHQGSKQAFIGILDFVDTVIVPYSNEVTYSTSYFEALARGKRVISLHNHKHFKRLNGLSSIHELGEIPDAVNRSYDDEVFWAAQDYYVDELYIDKLLTAVDTGNWESYRNHYRG